MTPFYIAQKAQVQVKVIVKVNLDHTLKFKKKNPMILVDFFCDIFQREIVTILYVWSYEKHGIEKMCLVFTNVN